MIAINILEQKFDVTKSYSGIDELVYLGLLDKINEIIDWGQCKFPEQKEIVVTDKVDEKGAPVLEDKVVILNDFLGDDPKLVPGIVFIIERQAFSFRDEKTLVLLSSETGGLGLSRVVNEVILTEYKIHNKIDCLPPAKQNARIVDNKENEYEYLKLPFYEFEKVTRLEKNLDVTEESSCINLPYGLIKFSERNNITCFPVSFEVKLDYLFVPIVLQVTKDKVYYYKDNIPFEEERDVVDLILAVTMGLFASGYLR